MKSTAEQDAVKTIAAESRVYPYAKMPVRKNANGSESRDVMKGTLPTGEKVSVHATEQPKGLKPNPAHAIEHTEVICVRTGDLEFMHDGKTERAKAGDMILVAKGTMHQVRNVGDGPVEYVVFSIGGDAA